MTGLMRAGFSGVAASVNDDVADPLAERGASGFVGHEVR